MEVQRQVVQWVWCLHCARCFSVLLTRKPDWEDDEAAQIYGESALDFMEELETQLGVWQGGEICAECPYQDCHGNLIDFMWWEEFSDERPELPEVPESGTVYAMYPDA